MNEGFRGSFDVTSASETEKDFQIGYFVCYEKTGLIMFRDAQQKEFDLARILILVKEWDFNNGEKNFPKPYLIAEDGSVKEFGANILYTYLNNSNARIVVFGAVADVAINHLDERLNPQANDYKGFQKKHLSRNNDSRFFLVDEDGKGNLTIYLKGKKAEKEEDNGTGNIGIKISGTDDNGNLSLSFNGKFAITQTQTDGDNETAIAQILMDNTKDAEKIKIIDKTKNTIVMNKDGIIIETENIRIGKTQTLKKILEKLIDAVTKITQNTPAGPTVSPPLNMAQFTSLKQELNEFMDKQ